MTLGRVKHREAATFGVKVNGILNKEESGMEMIAKNKNAEFSVLISLYIHEKAEYFDACMKSILNQTVAPNEIVIVKDGPVSEEVEKVIEKYVSVQPGLYRIVSYDQNRGLGYALAKGIEACSYELIARMDADDLARRDRFEKQLKEFEKDPALDICGSDINEFEKDPGIIVAKRKVPSKDEDIKEYQKTRDAFNHVSVMYKKSAILKAGNYQTCPLMEDTYLWVRMIQKGAKCKNIKEPLVYVRIGKDMYKRRGGFRYFLKYREGRKMVRKTNYIGAKDYYYTLAVQLCVALVPGSLRGWIFKKILHRNEKG